MKHSLKAITFVGILALFALGLGYPIVQARGPLAQATAAVTADAEATMQGTAEPTPLPVALANGLKIENNHSEDHVDKPGIDIKIDKPVMSGATGDVVDNFNKAVDDIIKATAGTFKDETISAFATATLPPDVPNINSYVEVAYEVLNGNATSNILSIKFNVGWYGQGAAHPNSYSMPLNYDLKNGKVIELADLFKPKAQYLKALSDYSTAYLKKINRLDFPEGALPEEANYRSWNVTPKGLQITFDDYQVTPHAAGPQQVLVPYATLKALIDPAGPLAEFLK